MTFALLASALLAAPTRADVPPDTLLAHARVRFARAEFAAAESLARVALPGVERTYGRSSVQTADALDLLLKSMWRANITLSAEDEALAARNVALRRALGDSAALARTLASSAMILGTRTHPREARDQGEWALRLFTAYAAKDSAGITDAHFALGRVYTMLGDGPSAELHYRANLAIHERMVGPDHPTCAYDWSGIATALEMQGDSEGARQASERALAIAEKQRPMNVTLVNDILLGLVQTCTRSGDWTRGRRYGERAVALTDSALGSDAFLTSIARYRLADVLAFLGDEAEAHRQAEWAVRALRSTLHEPNLVMCSALGISGEIFYDMHMLDSAYVRLQEAYELKQILLGPTHPIVVNARSRLATIEGERGHPQHALALLQSVRRAQEGKDLRWQIRADQSLANMHARLEHRAAAESLYHRLAALSDSLLGPRSPLTLEAEIAWAVSRYDLGDRAGAFALASQVQSTSREVLHEAIAGLAEREAVQFEGAIAHGTDLMLTMAADSLGLQPAERLATWDAVARGRLAVLSERAEERSRVPASDPEVARRVATLSAARDSLARVSARWIASGRSDSMAAVVDAARRRRESAERALGEVSATYRATRVSQGAGIQDATGALPPRSGLVGFVRYAHHQRAVAADSGLGALSEPRYVALVRSPVGTEAGVVPLGAAKPLDDVITRWLERTAHPAAPGDTVAWRRYRELGGQVRTHVWDPVLRRLGAVDRVFVVPDGLIAEVNPLALPTGSAEWLAESGPIFETLMTERGLVTSGAPGPAGRGLLALANPAYDLAPQGRPAKAASVAWAADQTHSRLRDADSLNLSALPGSALEVLALAEVWRTSTTAGGDADVLIGPFASEEAFKSRAPGHRVLHLATHGISLAGRRVNLERGTRGVGGVRVTQPSAPPEVRDDLAALAFAGAVRRDSSGAREDGWLTSEEVLTMDLSGVEWAVLSACESGAGDLRAGESVQGLVRAFQLAGARTVIASLWAVDDDATRDWMTRVYRARWLDERDTADAVRAASREVIAERRARGASTHPFYWGAFLATGAQR